MSGYKEKVAFPRGGEESPAGGGARKRAVINIVDNTLAPPNPEVLGQRYILDATGASHAGWDGASAWDLVEFNGTTWDAYTPEEGWVTYVDILNVDYRFIDDGTPQWELASVTVTLQNAYDGGENITLAVATPITVKDTSVKSLFSINPTTSEIAVHNAAEAVVAAASRSFTDAFGLPGAFGFKVQDGAGNITAAMERVDAGGGVLVNVISITPVAGDVLSQIGINDVNAVIVAELQDAGIFLGDNATDTATGKSISVRNGAGGNRFNIDGSTGDVTTVGDLTFTIPTVDETSSGIKRTATVDANATGIGAALFIAADFNYEEADADAAATMPCTALALETGTGAKLVLLKGFMRKDAWNWSAGLIYVDTNTGALTQTAPVGSGDQVQVVGYAVSADVLWFEPDATVLTVA